MLITAELPTEKKSELAFGTGGIRGLMGNGPGEINTAAIRRCAAAAALGLLADDKEKAKKDGVLIAYDTRHHSREFAKAAALTFAAYEIPAAIFFEPMPVPLLSFVLKRDRYCAGVMITASHNPKDYNGFKLYNARGGQLTPAEAAPIADFLQPEKEPPALADLTEAKAKGLYYTTGTAEYFAYLTAVTKGFRAKKPLTIVATPLHGAAQKLLPAALTRTGQRVLTVATQARGDGDFPTVAAPNPEDAAVFQEARRLGTEARAELLLATDGDGDRCGCCVGQGSSYRQLSANEIAAVLIDYLINIAKKPLPDDAYIVRTAVSGTLAQRIAAAKGIPTLITPTGFKYIGEKLLDKKNGTFFAGYEESGGFLAGNHAADKDGIATAVLLSAAATAHLRQGRSLLRVLNELYDVYGYEYNTAESFSFPGRDGKTRQKACFAYFQEHAGEWHIYKNSQAGEDTLFFDLAPEMKTALRPSGTEPKLKLYHTVYAQNEEAAKEILNKAVSPLRQTIIGFLPQLT